MKAPKIKWIADFRAKAISYGGRRNKKKVLGIVIHNTGNKKDTAKANVMFFSKRYGSNLRSAGAHFFVDQGGNIGRSIPMDRSAYSVGNPNGSYAPGTYNKILSNANTVSIELCDIMDKAPSEAMTKAVIELAKYIKYYCPNVKYVVRHFDVVRKNCPERFVKNTKEWQAFKSKITKAIKEV